jgi:hypothetical protein
LAAGWVAGTVAEAVGGAKVGAVLEVTAGAWVAGTAVEVALEAANQWGGLGAAVEAVAASAGAWAREGALAAVVAWATEVEGGERAGMAEVVGLAVGAAWAAEVAAKGSAATGSPAHHSRASLELGTAAWPGKDQ